MRVKRINRPKNGGRGGLNIFNFADDSNIGGVNAANGGGAFPKSLSSLQIIYP